MKPEATREMATKNNAVVPESDLAAGVYSCLHIHLRCSLYVTYSLYRRTLSCVAIMMATHIRWYSIVVENSR